MSKTSNRLYIEQKLSEGVAIEATPSQANYLLNVLRLGDGDEILLFDGEHGEWLAQIARADKRQCTLEARRQTRPQASGPDVHYLFAPVKRARLDFMVEKATELGASAIRPVITRRTIVSRVKQERMRANVIEAAEQCGILRIPQIFEPMKMETVLSQWDDDRLIIFCDEEAPVSSPLEALAGINIDTPCAVLIGPEGGFDPQEREKLRGLGPVLPISLGPRVMRADTAAVAILTLVNAALGDWL